MSVASKSMLRQASLFYRVCQSSITRQTLLPLSTSGRYHAESSSTNTATEEGKSFDSVPVHIGRIAKVVMVLGGLYPRMRDVPDSIPNRVYQKTKDKFRARCVIFSMFFTGALAFVASTRGKSAHQEGKRYTDGVYEMHRGESKLHEQLAATRNRRTPTSTYSLSDDIK